MSESSPELLLAAPRAESADRRIVALVLPELLLELVATTVVRVVIDIIVVDVANDVSVAIVVCWDTPDEAPFAGTGAGDSVGKKAFRACNPEKTVDISVNSSTMKANLGVPLALIKYREIAAYRKVYQP